MRTAQDATNRSLVNWNDGGLGVVFMMFSQDIANPPPFLVSVASPFMQHHKWSVFAHTGIFTVEMSWKEPVDFLVSESEIHLQLPDAASNKRSRSETYSETRHVYVQDRNHSLWNQNLSWCTDSCLHSAFTELFRLYKSFVGGSCSSRIPWFLSRILAFNCAPKRNKVWQNASICEAKWKPSDAESISLC